MIKTKFDPDYNNLDYGFYTCEECGKTFYGGGKAMHEKTCSQRGYEKCFYTIGPLVVAAVKEWAEKHGENDPSPNTGLSLADLKLQLPQL